MGGAGAGGGGPGGQAGARADGGAPDGSLSTGTFPYPGRWWASLSGAQGDGGAAVDRGPFVIHWSATDPSDRGLWTRFGVYPLAASTATDGSTTLLMDAPGTSGCWSIYATADVQSLQVQPCNQSPSSGTPPLGFFDDHPRLLAEIPLPPLGPSSNTLLTVNAGTTGPANGGGDWAVFSIGAETWYWRADLGRAFDLGRNVGTSAVGSPDGHWLLFLGPGSTGQQFPSLDALNTMTGTTTKIADSSVSLPVFSPDSRRAAFYANAPFQSRGDLVTYEFASGQTTTLAPHAYADPGTASTVAFFASGDRVVFAAYDASTSFSSGSIPMYAYDFTTADMLSFGDSMTLTPFPGQAYVALQTVTDQATGDGQVLLLHDEPGLAPKVLAEADSGAGVWPDATGTQVAYVSGGVLSIAAVAGTPPLTLPGDAVPFGVVAGPVRAEETTPGRPVAAWFASTGGIVHQVLGSGQYELRNDDPTTNLTTAFPIPDGWTFTLVSPLGDVVLTSGDSAAAVVWPNAPLNLNAPPGALSQLYQTVYVFSASDRYLTYQMDSYLMVHDFVSSTTTQLSSLAVSGTSVTSPQTAVSVVWLDSSTPMKAYAPDGTSWTLPGPGTGPLMNPSGTAMGYEGSANSATYLMRMQAGATPVIVGNGAPVAVTDTQVIFRDVDGVCAVALPAP